jgi:hypothetical protein
MRAATARLLQRVGTPNGGRWGLLRAYTEPVAESCSCPTSQQSRKWQSAAQVGTAARQDQSRHRAWGSLFVARRSLSEVVELSEDAYHALADHCIDDLHGKIEEYLEVRLPALFPRRAQ